MYVFYAQGGGLGHLTRIDKLIKTLEVPKEKVLIITPSIFAHYFKEYQFVLLNWKDNKRDWTNKIQQIIIETEVDKFYVDTFPFGLKGELNPVYNKFPKLTYVYISRILKWQTYLDAIPKTIPIQFSESLLLETLYLEHLQWIENHSETRTTITLKTEDVSPTAFSNQPHVLVVHSGGKTDVLKLCDQAINDNEGVSELKIIVFTQVDVELHHPKIEIHKNIYPVFQYYKHSQNIYTAAGYNSIQELKPYKEKHIVMPFEKLFDDQFFRIEKKY